MSLTLQRLFAERFKQFASQHRLSREMHQAAWCVIHCRTAALGGHVNRCPDGHAQTIAYNSCGHRCCPQCGWLEKEKWLARMRSRLLPVPHHHIIFTLPSQLRVPWLFNRRALANLLFEVASQTLSELLSDPKYLGARPGVVAVLHTWNQTLMPHLHLHCMVTAGGLDDQGRWREPRKSCLLPRKVLMIKFRGKFKAKLVQAVRQGRVTLPDGITLNALVREISKTAWNVKIFNAYPHGLGVATYLARYLKSGPIGNSRLLKIQENKLVFRHRQSTQSGGDGKRQVIGELPVSEFLKRWLQHVPPKRLQTVRGYGLYSGNQHSRIQEARSVLGVPLPQTEPPTNWQDWCEQAGLTEVCCCPVCGKRMVLDRRLEPKRPPPSQAISAGPKAIAN
jgi:hypothetical protein